MIGRLLQSAASTFGTQAGPRPQPALESVTEETHTRELLYPDIRSLRATIQSDLASSGGARPPTTARDAANYDNSGALDIAFPGDIRVLVAQDAHSRQHQPQILYDSRPARSPSPASPDGDSPQRPPLRTNKSHAGPASTPRHRPTPSGSFFSALSPTSPRSPSDKSRFAAGDPRARNSPHEPGDSETAQGKLAREAKEDTDALLGCMFGAPGFRLEPGTKLHILPRKMADSDGGKQTGSAARPISSGGFQRKRTPLVRSTSAADVSGGMSAAMAAAAESRSAGTKPSIMFTRLFTVTVTESTSTELGDEPSSDKATSKGAEADAHSPTARTQVKQKKVPMYAIAVILQLPSETWRRSRVANSPQGPSSLGSSLNDTTAASSWRGEQSAFASFMEIRSHGAFDTVLNSHIPHVLQHWNIINRALELLELCAKDKLCVLLDQVNPVPQLTPVPSPKPGTTKLKKPKLQNQQSVYVLPGCLQGDGAVKTMVDAASQRIVGALRTRRVIIGQGRWGAWREEARWVGRWAGGKEQNFFLFNFLTAFLGTHTEWLESLAPKWHRRRHALQQHIHGGKGNTLISHRTVIVSSDKMAARRLIFLLASFLPSHLNHHQVPVPPRDGQSTLSSESPPQFAPQRDGPSRRSGTQKSSLGRKSGAEAHARSVSFSLTEHDNEEAIDDRAHVHTRRDSDARSLRNSSFVATGETGSRKASMSTVIADTVQAVPHFSNLSYDDPVSPVAERKRPGSGGSMASFVLSHTLKRSESTAGSTAGSGGRWGSMVSGFWSNRRDSSTDDSDVFISSQESPRKQTFPRHEHRQSASGLERMVEEVDALRNSPQQPSLLSGSPRRPLQLDECLKPRHPALQESGSAARNIPRPRKPERLPLKLSFNEDEGYIDIAMDKEHSFSSSLASSFASIRHPLAPPFPGMAAPAHERVSPYGSITSDSPHTHPRSEPALDVAGWLKSYQPDFVLQAVRAYDALLADIKASMLAEAALAVPPAVEGDPGGVQPWTDVSTTLVADTTRFTIERLRLVRRPRAPSTSPPSVPPSRYPRYETRILTDPVMDLDTTLTDAVERILALSGPSSRASSPPRATHGSTPRPVPTANIPISHPPAIPPTDGATPRPVPTPGATASIPPVFGAAVLGPPTEAPHAECRRAIIGALEEVVRNVVAERERERERNGTVAVSGREPARQVSSEAGMEDGEGMLREGVRRWLGAVEGGW